MASDKSRRPVNPLPIQADAESAHPLRFVLERHHLAIAIVLVLLASVRIIGTYWVLSHTSDEPAHIGCGMEWLDLGSYTYEAQHPPLARVAAALGPYLMGRRPRNFRGYAQVNKEPLMVFYKEGL